MLETTRTVADELVVVLFTGMLILDALCFGMVLVQLVILASDAVVKVIPEISLRTWSCTTAAPNSLQSKRTLFVNYSGVQHQAVVRSVQTLASLE